MPQASSRTLSTVVTTRRNAKRRRKLSRIISSRTLLATASLLSETYDLSPSSCHDDALEMENGGEASLLSRSSNAFWHRKSKASGKKQSRNNSTASETQTASSNTFRQSFVERWKRNKKRPPTMITARSVLRKRTSTKVIAQRQNSIHPLTTTEISVDPPSLTQGDTLQSSSELDQLAVQDDSNANDDNANPTLEATIASCVSEQQNINATNNTQRSIHGTSQSTVRDQNLSRKTKLIISRTNRSKTTRRPTVHSSKRITKRKKKKRTFTSKRNNSRQFLSKNRRKIFPYSPFPDLNQFHSIPPMKDSDEITKENIRTNHLCCKPITSVKGLSSNDQKKLIEHDYLTLISLLPMYLGSQGHFQQKIREKTEISADGASELDHLMNEWGSARLFIGMNNPYKTLTQKI